MAMAYCKTCGYMGNFTACPNRFEREDDGTWMIHRVQYDEVYDNDSNNDSNDSSSDTPGDGETDRSA